MVGNKVSTSSDILSYRADRHGTTLERDVDHHTSEHYRESLGKMERYRERERGVMFETEKQCLLFMR